MAERRFGPLIAIGSIQQVREHPEMLVYAASKAALESMVRNADLWQIGPVEIGLEDEGERLLSYAR